MADANEVHLASLRSWLRTSIEDARHKARLDRLAGNRLGEDIYLARKGAFEDALKQALKPLPRGY